MILLRIIFGKAFASVSY